MQRQINASFLNERDNSLFYPRLLVMPKHNPLRIANFLRECECSRLKTADCAKAIVMYRFKNLKV
jgi:hypothetical protein